MDRITRMHVLLAKSLRAKPCAVVIRLGGQILGRFGEEADRYCGVCWTGPTRCDGSVGLQCL